MELVN